MVTATQAETVDQMEPIPFLDPAMARTPARGGKSPETPAPDALAAFLAVMSKTGDANVATAEVRAERTSAPPKINPRFPATPAAPDESEAAPRRSDSADVTGTDAGFASPPRAIPQQTAVLPDPDQTAPAIPEPALAAMSPPRPTAKAEDAAPTAAYEHTAGTGPGVPDVLRSPVDVLRQAVMAQGNSTKAQVPATASADPDQTGLPLGHPDPDVRSIFQPIAGRQRDMGRSAQSPAAPSQGFGPVERDLPGPDFAPQQAKTDRTWPTQNRSQTADTALLLASERPNPELAPDPQGQSDQPAPESARPLLQDAQQVRYQVRSLPDPAVPAGAPLIAGQRDVSGLNWTARALRTNPDVDLGTAPAPKAEVPAAVPLAPATTRNAAPDETTAQIASSPPAKTATFPGQMPAAPTAQSPDLRPAGATPAPTELPPLSEAELESTGLVAMFGTESASAPRFSDRAVPGPALFHHLPPGLGARMAEAATQFPDRPVEITLSPEELGRVRMSFTTHDGALTMLVQADRPETLDLLRRHIETLAQDFRDLGFENLSFSFGQTPYPHEAADGGTRTSRTAPGTTRPRSGRRRPNRNPPARNPAAMAVLI